jgi:Ca2+-binding EF-hand superfamily protein
VDTDHNGKINYTEFLAATLGKDVYGAEGKMNEAFKLFDAVSEFFKVIG